MKINVTSLGTVVMIFLLNFNNCAFSETLGTWSGSISQSDDGCNDLVQFTLPEDSTVSFNWSFTRTSGGYYPGATYALVEYPGNISHNSYLVRFFSGQEIQMQNQYSSELALAGSATYYFQKCNDDPPVLGSWELTITYVPIVQVGRTDQENNDNYTNPSDLSLENIGIGSIGYMGDRKGTLGGTNASRWIESYDYRDFYMLNVQEGATLTIETIVSDGLKYTVDKDRLKLAIYDTWPGGGVYKRLTIDTTHKSTITLPALSPPLYLVAELLEYEDGSKGYGGTIHGTYNISIGLGKETLAISKTGTGTGIVTSAPEGISCGNSCSFDFETGSTVTLTAIPDNGTIFTGWSGACSGAGNCIVTMDTMKNISAAFSLNSAKDPSSLFFIPAILSARSNEK